MDTTKLIGRKVRDTKSEYKGDIGEITDIRTFEKAQKTYAVVQWSKGSKHGDNVYRLYPPKAFGGIFDRFKFID